MAAIIFTITAAGLNAALDAANTGFSLQMTELSGHDASGTEIGRWPLGGGIVEPNSNVMHFHAVLKSSTQKAIYGLKLWADDVVFATAQRVDPLVVIDANIDFAASFAMAMAQIPTEAITISTDINTPYAQILMTQHLGAVNPHPQYADKAQNTLEHSNLLSLITAANQARQNGDDYLLDLINALNANISSLYPKTIASGVLNQPSGGNPRSMLSATQGWSVGGADSKDIVNTLGVDLTNVRYGLSVTPEGSHEAWNITRQQNGFNLSIFNRSGQNRIGYSGNVNWSVIETMPSGVDEGNGSYGPGSYSFFIYPNTAKLIRLWGAGAGGSASELSTATTSTPAKNGLGTTFTAMTTGSTIAGANGGSAGSKGVWSNGSAYSNGEKGLGGTTFFGGNGFSVTDSQVGADGHQEQLDHSGGSSGRFGDYGRGGHGADGVGDEGYAWGGGGGEGGYIEFTYSNSSADPILVRITVGTAGLGGTTDNGTNGTDGIAGFATVASAV